MGEVQVAGVRMVPFATPSKSQSYDAMAGGAIRAALADASITLEQVQQAYAGYVYADSTSGQKALYGVRKTGIPVVNVNNNCSTGSSALGLTPEAPRRSSSPTATTRTGAGSSPTRPVACCPRGTRSERPGWPNAPN